MISTMLMSFAALALQAPEPGSATVAANGSDGAAPAASAQQSAPAREGERKICRTYANTASRLRAERLCLTAKQWRTFDAQQ